MKEFMLEAAIYEKQFNTEGLESNWQLRPRLRSQIREAWSSRSFLDIDLNAQ